jgi:hypothetical protein
MTIWSSENDHLYFIMMAILNFICLYQEIEYQKLFENNNEIIFSLKCMVKKILKMCLETHVADETKTTTMQFLLEQCLNYIYQVQFH